MVVIRRVDQVTIVDVAKSRRPNSAIIFRVIKATCGRALSLSRIELRQWTSEGCILLNWMFMSFNCWQYISLVMICFLWFQNAVIDEATGWSADTDHNLLLMELPVRNVFGCFVLIKPFSWSFTIVLKHPFLTPSHCSTQIGPFEFRRCGVGNT